MLTSLFPFPVFVAYNQSTGAPLAGGKLYTYVAGTNIPLATYTTAAGNVANTNPVVLDAAGSANVWYSNSTYKVVLKDASDVVQWTQDNVSPGVLAPVNYTVIDEIQSATSNQSVFTLTTTSYTPGTNTLQVFVDGVNQYFGSTYSFTETNPTTVTFTSGLHLGAVVKFTTAVSLSAGVTTSDLVSY